jgi:hypothetical protein
MIPQAVRLLGNKAEANKDVEEKLPYPKYHKMLT